VTGFTWQELQAASDRAGVPDGQLAEAWAYEAGKWRAVSLPVTAETTGTWRDQLREMGAREAGVMEKVWVEDGKSYVVEVWTRREKPELVITTGLGNLTQLLGELRQAGLRA